MNRLENYQGGETSLSLSNDFFSKVSVMAPADIVKVRLQCQTEPIKAMDQQFKPKYRGPIHCLVTIVREEGFLGLYKGAGALALRDGPSFATYFLTYNTICDWLTPEKQSKPGKATQTMKNAPLSFLKSTIRFPDIVKGFYF